MSRTPPVFRACYAREETGWTAHIDEPRLSVRARGLESARIALVEAVAEHFDVSPSIVTIEDDVAIARPVDRLVAQAHKARDQALAAQARSNAALGAAALAARDAGVSLRDSAYLLGLSHSRIQQVVDAAERRTT